MVIRLGHCGGSRCGLPRRWDFIGMENHGAYRRRLSKSGGESVHNLSAPS
jgi:hypothetical protein